MKTDLSVLNVDKSVFLIAFTQDLIEHFVNVVEMKDLAV